MRIAIKPLPQGGAVSWFRGTGPGHYLATPREGVKPHAVAVLSTTIYTHAQQREAVRTADVVHVLGAMGGKTYAEAPEEFRNLRGALSVDLDDDIWAWLEDSARATAAEAKMVVAGAGTKEATSETVAAAETWLKAADVVTTTTAYLAERIRERVPGAIVRVVENAVPPEAQKMRQAPRPSEVMAKLGRPRGGIDLSASRVVGWTGSVAHVHDLPPVLEALARMRSVDGALSARSLGPVDWMQSPGFAKVFTGREDYTPVTWRNPRTLKLEIQVPFEHYYDALEGMAPDVAVIPMRPSSFNLSKSAVTLYSWAAQGVPCVVSDTGPYAVERERGFPARYVPHEDRDAWVAALRDLLYAKAEAKELGERARQWVMKHHAFPKAADAWAEAWREACERRGVKLEEGR